MKKNKSWTLFAATISTIAIMYSCKPKNEGNAISADAAGKTYVAPGKYDEFYNFVSGGFNGQMSAGAAST